MSNYIVEDKLVYHFVRPVKRAIGEQSISGRPTTMRPIMLIVFQYYDNKDLLHTRAYKICFLKMQNYLKI